MNQSTKRLKAVSRRDFLKKPILAAATTAILPSIIGSGVAKSEALVTCDVSLSPRYFPMNNLEPEIDLSGKLAVITGASRGIGRATAETLASRGVEVIGSSRNPRTVPDPPSFPLLELDITNTKSVNHFVKDLRRKVSNRKIDILINNAGRFVLGSIIPNLSSVDFYDKQYQLGFQTLCLGHIRITNALLPFMPTAGYARLLFTVSVAAYVVGATDPITPWAHGYTSAKRGLLAYANSLRGALSATGSNIKISTVNPYFVATVAPEHPNPIYTEPVGDNGFTDDPPTPTPFNQFLTFIRERQAAGLPPSLVGAAYAQLLSMNEPPPNVVAASTEEPLATQGGNTFLESLITNENTESAPHFVCG